MAKIKLTKSAVDAAQPQAQPIELRDTLVPGFLCKITPTGRKAPKAKEFSRSSWKTTLSSATNPAHRKFVRASSTAASFLRTVE